MLVAGSRGGMNRDARNGPLGKNAFRGLVTFVGAVSVRPGGRRSIFDQLTAIDDGDKIQILRIDAKPAFRQQQIAQNDAWALEAVGNIENLRDDFEAVSDIERRGKGTRIIAERCAQHLPEIALLGLRGNTCGWASPLAVDYYHGSLHHGGQAETFAH